LGAGLLIAHLQASIRIAVRPGLTLTLLASQGNVDMMKIYVGNLNFQSTDDDLRNLFSQHGQVNSALVVVDRNSGRSRGFGFVEMEDDEAAQKAIAKLNGTELAGRNLKVNEARPRAIRGKSR
jgi:RNA recognition motif-containing protein